MYRIYASLNMCILAYKFVYTTLLAITVLYYTLLESKYISLSCSIESLLIIKSCSEPIQSEQRVYKREHRLCER